MSAEKDLALRLIVSREWAEAVGAMLMDRLGPYAEEAVGPNAATDKAALTFYPKESASLSDAEVLGLLPPQITAQANITVVHLEVSRDWVDGWKDHFHPVTVGRVRIRPPWEAPLEDASLIDVVINPGLGFGTGLHPTTRGTLTLLQADAGGGFGHVAAQAGPSSASGHGPLVDSGTGSGVLSIAAAKLGWGPVLAFDNDAAALVSARDNLAENGVAGLVEVVECDVEAAPPQRFAGATVLANMTLIPVLALLRRLTEAPPKRLVVSGILAGAQEETVVREAVASGLRPGRRLYEAEWVSMELVPDDDSAVD